MKFMWGLLTGAFLGAIVTMWYINRQMSNSPQATPTEVMANALPEDFPAFLDRFATDSLFQMSRISFPLAGLPAYADSIIIASNSFRYHAEDWVLHKPFNTSLEFKQEYEVAGDALVIENIVNSNAGFGMQRRFARLNGDWHLIYYAGINKIGG